LPFDNLESDSESSLSDSEELEEEENHYIFKGTEHLNRIEFQILNTEPNYSLIIEKGHSRQAVDLLHKLLLKNKESRLTMQAAMKHPWFNPHSERNNSIYRKTSKLLGK